MSSGEMSAEPRTVTIWQTFYWCVRRELFEHRSIYLAPAAAAGVALFGFLINTVHLPAHMHAAIADPAKMKGLGAPFEYAAAAIMMVAMVVQLFYCLDSLQSERRDRSILFWKSLPVSDVTTVLAKATIPFAILPLLSFGVVVVTGIVDWMADYGGLFGGRDSNSEAPRTKLDWCGKNGVRKMITLLLTLHISGGVVGILSGAVAMVFRKGFRWHALAGQVFVVAMLEMAGCGGVVAGSKK